MRLWVASGILAVATSGCACDLPLEITGTVRYLESGKSLKGAEIQLLSVGDQVPPSLPKVETYAVTFSDEDGNYSFKVERDHGFMVQLVPSACHYMGDRMPVRADAAEQLEGVIKVVVDLGTRADQCHKD